ncbi:MAG: hypothetical protein FWE23_06090 [Chitinivibrionia bacterium]|nr:hypothetical protein [Chitinivibrionia bacterium]
MFTRTRTATTTALNTDLKRERIGAIKNKLPDIFGEEIKDVRVEEIWEDVAGVHFTFSFLSPRADVFKRAQSSKTERSPYEALFDYERLYKEVVLDKNGNIISIKMHKNA